MAIKSDLVDWEITEVVSGKARGVDTLGEWWAKSGEKDIPIQSFPADWKKFKKAAGYIRNAEMAKYADALIAIWDGESRGTFNMIEEAMKNRLRIAMFYYEPRNGILVA